MRNVWKLSIILLSFTLLVACGSETNSEPADGQNTQLSTTIKGGRTGGAWAVFTEGIAESIRRENGGSFITVEPGSIIENPLMVGTGKVPYGLSYSMTAYAAYRGLEPYNQAFKDIRAVSVVVPANYYQLFTREELGVTSIADLLESNDPLRISVNQQGSAGEVITREILKFYGVSYEEIISEGGSVDFLSGSMAFELMADGRLDAAGNAESAPSSNIIEAATTTNLNMISFEKEVIQTIAKNLGMEPNIIPAGTYDFLAEDVHTVSTPAILMVHKDVSDEEVYAVTNSIYNNLNYLDTVHEEFKALTKRNMSNVGELPLHPGAEKFFKEKGLLEK
ncbi:TAXI family TRAP transporter solute-binding subunit [Oceanobacillus alkalisoli]|uniref:TAXI family TRAP transporter solute-binding subunit n=1 Tax=Oceanobacillus alkalisoli TaxID=2925113 RepID=UPI001EF07A3A|nr:TAXI family TRAP transporter solute-binding subunit [Oceanobacillus alkalisoli]MCF3944183.1 TAXI family TRAP transporter solute-binding subunit [Oceanobacillus alkalisoli]MCG5103211.1 TAXI family TRAP transporter solute-binding subunit [Oceanobacillus alkalisoli]